MRQRSVPLRSFSSLGFDLRQRTGGRSSASRVYVHYSWLEGGVRCERPGFGWELGVGTIRKETREPVSLLPCPTLRQKRSTSKMLRQKRKPALWRLWHHKQRLARRLFHLLPFMAFAP